MSVSDRCYELCPWRKAVVYPRRGFGGIVTNMEDVLDLYARPED